MILVKDLIKLLQRANPDDEIVVYEGLRAGLHVSHSINEPYGWIEIGYNDSNIVSCDDDCHIMPEIEFEEIANHWY